MDAFTDVFFWNLKGCVFLISVIFHVHLTLCHCVDNRCISLHNDQQIRHPPTSVKRIIKGTVQPITGLHILRPSKIRISLFLHQVWRQCLSNGCSAVNGCRQNESQWMLCSGWVPSEWEPMDALQWMGAVRMRVNGCSAVNGCRQNESQWMLCSEWVPSEWESMDALQWMGAVRMRVNGGSAVDGCRQNESQWMLCSGWVPSEWESMDALQWMGAVRMRVW